MDAISGTVASLAHGLKPVVKSFSDAEEELAFILEEIRKLKDARVILSNICVTRTKKLVDDYIAQITRAGLRAYEIKRSKTEDRSRDGVR